MGSSRGIPYTAAQDDNRFPSLIAVTGTAGTADTAGTSDIVRVGANPTTGALYVQDLAGVSGTTNVVVLGGTLNAGTVTTTLALNTGTITTIVAGTQNTLGTVGTVIGAGTITNLGSITNIGSIAAGVLNTLTTVSNLTNGSVNVLTGTLQSSGTTTGVGTVTNLGSVTNIGSIAAGVLTSLTTVSNLTNGSINVLTGTIQSSGTTTGVGTVTNLGSVTNVGSIAAGVITTVSNLTNGSVTMTAGTVTGGTLGNLNYGTIAIDAKPAGSAILTTHTLGTGGGTFFGTMVAPVGAGTYIYLTGVSIVSRSGGSIDIGIANNVAGTTGAGVIARGFFPTAGAGIRQEYNPALRIGTNGTLAYFLITAGTADFVASYWVGP